MSTKTKLELTWIGKENRPKLEPRILIEESDKSYCAQARHNADLFDNKLIFGDNLLALKALEAEYAGQVKCVFIDPPYNTGTAFEQYDDGVEHSLWLSLMRDRLTILNRLISNAGSIWISIDDNEAHYLKVLMDEVFGRRNFIASISWQKKYAVKSDSEFFSESHDYILVYAKNRDQIQLNRFPRTETQDARYKNPDNDSRGVWTSGPLQRNEARDYAIFPIVSPKTGKQHWPPKGTSWRFTKDRIEQLISEDRIWFGETGNNVPRLKRFLTDVEDSMPATTWWDYQSYGHNDEAKREAKALTDHATLFATPKPERLLNKILTLATNPGDLVLDSFLGSGTTAAVAHKMGRRWIGIELGEHCHTHCIPRLKKVIDGQDPGGITEAVSWKGGGGFRYYRLAPSLLEQDKWGNWVTSKEYNGAMLAEALCKLEGFRYEPSPSVYWMHGRSSEHDFLYATTQNLSPDQLQALSDEVGPGRSLLVLCAAYRADGDKYPNLTLKKIPKTVLAKCEWGHDDYSLKIENLPKAPDSQAPAPVNAGRKSKAKAKSSEPDLFGEDA